MAQVVKEIEKLFAMMQKYHATDLHLKSGAPPIFRVQKSVRRMEREALTNDQIATLVYDIMTPGLKQTFEETGQVDFAYSVPGVGRYRINVYRQRGSVSVAVRRVEFDIPSVAELNLPEAVNRIAQYEQGLILIAGITGSGKSTTLAALIDQVNATRRCHIITIEDPIEYLYQDKVGFVNQREVGIDVSDYHDALKYVVRQDPDVILIGELRDSVGVETSLIAAETGHLVFGTVHAASCAQIPGRILDMFTVDRHPQIRQLLFFNLRAAMVQKLLKGTKPETPLVPVMEIMFCNPTVRKLIREGGDNKISDAILAAHEEGMQTMNQSLEALIRSGMIAERVGMDNSPNPEQLRMALKGIRLGADEGGIIG